MEPTDQMRERLDELERERQWVTDELHDGLLQSVVAAHMTAEVLRRKWPATEGPEPTELAALLGHLQQAMAEGRSLLDRAHEANQRAHDLADRLDMLINQTRWDSDREFTFDIDLPKLLSPAIQHSIYRLLQEAISNIRRHSNASHVRIALQPRAGRVWLQIEDDGCGFDADHTVEGNYGLLGMRRRVERMGGTFTLQTAPGQGTRITIDLPPT